MHIGPDNNQFVTASICPVTLRLFHAMQHILSAERLREHHPTLVLIRLHWKSRDCDCQD